LPSIYEFEENFLAEARDESLDRPSRAILQPRGRVRALEHPPDGLPKIERGGEEAAALPRA
jgi:hypothetical protein